MKRSLDIRIRLCHIDNIFSTDFFADQSSISALCKFCYCCRKHRHTFFMNLPSNIRFHYLYDKNPNFFLWSLPPINMTTSNFHSTVCVTWVFAHTTHDAFRCSLIFVFAFGILGNILVIISILRLKKLLKNNYYFSILDLAICDLGVLVLTSFDDIFFSFVETFHYSDANYLVRNIDAIFGVAGKYVMLIIAALSFIQKICIHNIVTYSWMFGRKLLTLNDLSQNTYNTCWAITHVAPVHEYSKQV